MNMPDRVNLTVNLVDGTQHKFEFPPKTDAKYSLGVKIEKLLQSRSLAFALEDRLLVIPTHQIRSFEVSPVVSTAKMPDSVFLDAKMVE